MEHVRADWGSPVMIGVQVVALIAAAVATRTIAARGIRALAKRIRERERELICAAAGPLAMLGAIAVFWAGAHLLPGLVPLRSVDAEVFAVMMVVTVGWAVAEVARAALARAARNAEPGVETRIVLIRRLITILVTIITTVLAAVQIPVLRSLGLSLLASAGLAGIIIGVASQNALSMLLAGVQVSFTQPVRIGDTVTIENELGTVTELTLTQVKVRLRDGRQLIVPTTRVLSQPLVNWTRGAKSLTGTVDLKVPLRVSLDDMRATLTAYVQTDKRWDGTTAVAKVLEVTETTMLVRCTVSARNPDDLSGLREGALEALLVDVRPTDATPRPAPRASTLPAQSQAGAS